MDELLIVGASVRAAAQSAVRSGWKVLAADAYGDRDLRAMASYVPVASYPKDIEAIRCRFAHLPVMYTGALENHPRLLESMQRAGSLLGNAGHTVRRLRDPACLGRALHRHGIPFPRTTVELPLGEGAGWLRKPVRSAGGLRIARCSASTARVAEEGFCFQQFVPGQSVSASFVAAGRAVVLLGATDILVGCRWLGTERFVYAGSIFRPLSTEERDQWERIGTALASEFSLTGLFGVDAILRKGSVIPLEVNPRYTASMEVLEHSLEPPMVQLHYDAVTTGRLPQLAAARGAPWAAKAIVYARHEVIAPAIWSGVACFVTLADVPPAGTRIQPGRPLLSMLVSAPRRPELMSLLRQQAAIIYGQLAVTTSPAPAATRTNRGVRE